MKLLSTFLSLIAMAPLPLFSGCAGEKPSGALLSYEYSYSTTAAWPQKYIKITREAPGAEVRLYHSEGESEMTVLKAPGEAFDTIDSLVRSTRLRKLKESYRPPFRVLDGWSWHLSIRWEEGSIYSGGHNARPKPKLKDGIDAINAYLQTLVDGAAPEDILGTEPFR